jgi:hypothetical protein
MFMLLHGSRFKVQGSRFWFRVLVQGFGSTFSSGGWTTNLEPEPGSLNPEP